MGGNAASNAPRMMTWLAEADRRGTELVHINPLLEAASRRTIVPHEFVDMATFRSTKIGTRNVQVRIGVGRHVGGSSPASSGSRLPNS